MAEALVLNYTQYWVGQYMYCAVNAMWPGLRSHQYECAKSRLILVHAVAARFAGYRKVEPGAWLTKIQSVLTPAIAPIDCAQFTFCTLVLIFARVRCVKWRIAKLLSLSFAH